MERMMMGSISNRKRCAVCGRLCEETGTVKHNRAWICRNCDVKYFDRDPEMYREDVYVVFDEDDEEYKFTHGHRDS